MAEQVCVGIVVGAHGVRGQVRIRSFTAKPAEVGAYGPVQDKSGTHRFMVQVTGTSSRNVVLAVVAGIADRSHAEALQGTYLFVPRAALPEPEEDTFYWADLIGLTVILPDGELVGRVKALHDFGAGIMLEVAMGVGRTVMVPFTRAAVPKVDVTSGQVVVACESGVFAVPSHVTADKRGGGDGGRNWN